MRKKYWIPTYSKLNKWTSRCQSYRCRINHMSLATRSGITTTQITLLGFLSHGFVEYYYTVTYMKCKCVIKFIPWEVLLWENSSYSLEVEISAATIMYKLTLLLCMGKFWYRKKLANLANRMPFANLLPTNYFLLYSAAVAIQAVHSPIFCLPIGLD